MKDSAKNLLNLYKYSDRYLQKTFTYQFMSEWMNMLIYEQPIPISVQCRVAQSASALHPLTPARYRVRNHSATWRLLEVSK